MSRNSFNKRMARKRHRNEFSRYPYSKVDLGKLIMGITPQSTPLMDMLTNKSALDAAMVKALNRG